MAIAPATADLIAKLAHGLADDFSHHPLPGLHWPRGVAPAMNSNMWRHPATQANLETLRQRGHRIVEPESGYLACGMTGPGRLADPAAIVEAIERESRRRHDLDGETVLITAGPTQEPLDPVRYISNRSSGKMGYALAEAAAARGRARHSDLRPRAPGAPTRPGSDFRAHRRRDAPEGFREPRGRQHRRQGCRGGRFPSEQSPDQKVKKTAARLSPGTRPHPDILAELGRKKGDRLLIGFAAEKRKTCTRKPAASWNPRTAT